MTNEAKPIRRRRRAARDIIPEGEMRNVTFRVGSRAYNLLVQAANESGHSVSELGERLIEQHLGEPAHEKIKQERDVAHLKDSDSLDLSNESKRVVGTIGKVLSEYDKVGGWSNDDLNKVGARFAVTSVLEHAMHLPPDVAAVIYSDEPSDVKAAADRGIHFGSLYWSPIDFLKQRPSFARDVLSHPSIKGDVERMTGKKV